MLLVRAHKEVLAMSATVFVQRRPRPTLSELAQDILVVVFGLAMHGSSVPPSAPTVGCYRPRGASRDAG
jgi:hypothetical protein